MDLYNDQPVSGENSPSCKQTTSSVESNSARQVNRGLAPIVALMPVDEFRGMGIVPVSYNQDDRRLKLVCASAVDEPIRQAVSVRLPNISLEWYQADEKVIEIMLRRLAVEYSVCDVPRQDEVPATVTVDTHVTQTDLVPPVVTLNESTVSAATEPRLAAVAEPTPQPIVPPGQKVVLFVTPAGKISQHLLFALNAERCLPITVSTLDQAAIEVEQRSVACVFIHEKLHGRSEQFTQRLAETSPETPVRHYSSEAALLLNDTRNQATFDLVRQNLTLFSRLSISQGSGISDHAAAMARLADRMAVRMGVPDHCRLMITTAAFLHNMAEDNLKSSEGLKQTDIISLSASRLEAWGFPIMVVRMLRRMYRSIGDPGLAADGVEATGGYILTAADVFCHLFPERASTGNQMELIQRKLEDQLQWRVMPSVINTLIDVVCDDCTARLLRPNTFLVHLLAARGSVPEGLIDALREKDFTITSSSTIHDCALSCRQAKADLLIIRDSGSVQDVYDTMMSLALRGIAIDQLNAVLLLEPEVVTDALRLLPHGIEEILPASVHPQAIVTKLTRIKTRLEEQYRHRVSAIERLGTHGSLSDMCLTDILEIWRGNRRPARLSVTAFGSQLTVYLDRGKVIAAECGECEGMNALLRGVSWRQGIWNIDSIDSTELPEPNIDQSIDAVLIEACTTLDEVVKDEPMYALPSSAR